MRLHCLEGLFSDPIYGGNRDKSGWKALGHPGVWLENSAEENLCSLPVTKGGQFQSIADLTSFNREPDGSEIDLETAQYDGSLHAPVEHADVLLVGVGGVGGMIAPMLTRADCESWASKQALGGGLRTFYPTSWGRPTTAARIWGINSRRRFQSGDVHRVSCRSRQPFRWGV